MLQLKDIKKTYVSGDEKVEALKGIDLKFRESEFVSILGQSGCGKTTLLNIIGGLDRYTTGDLIINGKSTKKFKDRDWDAYRNYKVGFVFQNYNLIGHQTILSNVELALTIGGVSRKDRKQRAIKALEQVGLKDKIHKKPNQLSGGQMQRVAIARALVNDPDIILADEPTGALDTKTSIQIMEILKEISKEKLIIMVTHNPELAQQYSSRIIRILDGVITEDSNPILDTEVDEPINNNKIGRTSMKFWTAFRLSLNNLLTKKGRTILVSFAGSIGIIGIALVQAVSNGFQNYVDYIQEDTLTSYPLTIMQESADTTSMLLAMTSSDGDTNRNSNEVKEEQYISSMLANITTNDLQSFNNYLKTNFDNIKDDVSSISYSYSVEPAIYTKDVNDTIPTKLNPSELFSSMMGGSSIMGMSTSVYSQMIDDKESLMDSYDVLAGKWPENYDEMIVVLSEPNKISDYLVYSLGLRDYKELEDIVKKVMNGEKANVQNEPLTLTYEDLMKIELKLILGTDIYKYNQNYDIYEDMSENEEYMNNIYANSMNLKIVGVVSSKEGVNSMALSPGVAYTSGLVDYIINKTKDTDIVKRQLENDEIDVISGKGFDSKDNKNDLNFANLISVDSEKLQSAFNIKIDEKSIQKETQGYMIDIANSITTDITPAKNLFKDNLNTFANEIMDGISGEIKENEIDGIVSNYLGKQEQKSKLKKMEQEFTIPKETFETTYSGLLKGLLQVYLNAYKASSQGISGDSQLEENNISKENLQKYLENNNISQEEIQKYLENNNISQEDMQKYLENLQKESDFDPNVITQSVDSNIVDTNTITENQKEVTDKISKMINLDEMKKQIKETVISTYMSNSVVEETVNTMAKVMTEATMKKQVLTKVGELTANLTGKFATAFNVDQEKIASAFNVNISEDELTRVITAMMTGTKKSAKTNLISFGYQDKEKPTYIAFYFKSFEGKEHFLSFLDSYNEKMEADGQKDKVINYSDTTGILMGSVKTIVNAVTYVLIAFISISLIVSSIMIGIITYISVYERTKEIGILRAIGASKHNISSIFNAETFIIGLLSGLFGIGITYALIPLINKVLHHFTGNIPLNVVFYFKNALVLVILSVILTLIGGLIPSRAASKKDPVIALRTE